MTGRPRKILYVTAGLRGGGAEAMLTRLVTAQPGLADEITLVSLLPAEGHIERLIAGGVRVLELQFDKMGGVAAGLLKLAKLIADSRPDIVQGWMYHGDLAALVALVMSGRRKQTRLVWSIRCSDMDLRHYGRGLRLVVKACTLLSSWPDLVTANSAAGLKSHLALGYRPRRAEVVANGIDVDEFRPDPTVTSGRAQRARHSGGRDGARSRGARRSDEGPWQLSCGHEGTAGFVRAAGRRRDGKSSSRRQRSAPGPPPRRPPPVRGRGFRGVELRLR